MNTKGTIVSIGKSLTTSFPAFCISFLYPFTLSTTFLTNSALAASSKVAPYTVSPATSTLKTNSFSLKTLAVYFRSTFSFLPSSYCTLKREIGPSKVKSVPSYCPLPEYLSCEDSAPTSFSSEMFNLKSKSLTSPF